MKLNHKHKYLLLLLPFCFWGGKIGLDHWEYAKSDAIGRTKIDTKKVLERYESTKDVTEVRYWLLNNQDAAIGSQMSMTLANWAVDHQSQFVELLQSLPSPQRGEFIQVFSGAINQASPKNFETAFKDSPSPIIKAILKTLSENRPVAW